MNININVKRTFKMNGKEYNSVEEMPEDVRAQFTKVMGLLADSEKTSIPTVMQMRITFNATLGGDETVAVSPVSALAEPGRDMRREPGTLGVGNSKRISQPTRFEASFSARTLIVCVAIGALACLLYYIWHIRR